MHIIVLYGHAGMVKQEVRIRLQYLPVGKKFTFCDIKSLIFTRSCSNFEHFSFQISAKFERSDFKNNNSLYLPIIKNCGF